MVLVLRGHGARSAWRLTSATMFVAIGVISFVLSFAAPAKLHGFIRRWMQFGEAIGRATSEKMPG